MSNQYVTKVTLTNSQIVLTVQVDEFQPGESLEISGYATQNGGALAVFYDIQPVPEQNPDGTTYMYVKALASQEFKKGHDVTVFLRAAKVWVTVLGEPQPEKGPSQEQGELAEEGTAWTMIKAVSTVGPIQSLPRNESATTRMGRSEGTSASPPPTAADILREDAPEAVRRSEEIGLRLTDQAEQIGQFAEEHGIWVSPGTGEQRDRAPLPDEKTQWWLRGSGLLGTGVTRRTETGEHTSVVFVRIGHPAMEISAGPEGPPNLRDHWRLLTNIGIEPGATLLIGLPEPIAQVGPADPAFCNAPPGTFGARVQATNGGRGLLTAGHVAPATKSGAYTSANSRVGTVVASLNIATLPPGQPGFDIALIELATSALDTGPIQPSSLVPRPGQIGDNVAGYGRFSMGAQSRLVTAGAPFAGPNWAAGSWANASITVGHISTGGDSGGMVLDSSTGRLIGHIVGGYPGVYSIIQDAQAQLQALGSALR